MELGVELELGNYYQVDSWQHKIIREIRDLKEENEEQAKKIKSLGTKGSWCGYQSFWSSKGIITYDRITFSSSNMEITSIPLDIITGINSHKS